MSAHVLLTSKKAYVTQEKYCGVLRENSVDGRLLLAVTLLYSCSEVCVRVFGVKSQQFTVGFELRQGCVVSALLFITCWILAGELSRVSLSEAAGSTVCFLRRIWYWSHAFSAVPN